MSKKSLVKRALEQDPIKFLNTCEAILCYPALICVSIPIVLSQGLCEYLFGPNETYIDTSKNPILGTTDSTHPQHPHSKYHYLD